MDYSSEQRFRVDRFLCVRCALTISVLPNDRLPYRRLTTTELAADFDARAAGNPGPPATVLVAAALLRAWLALARQRTCLCGLLGQLLPATLNTPGALWQSLRRWGGSLTQILHRLAAPFRTSLCGHYRCLQPPATVGT